MTATDLLLGNVGTIEPVKVHARYMCYILNKEYNFTQKDIAEALNITATKVSNYIKEVDKILLSRRSCYMELDTTRKYLTLLGYKRLTIDVRSVVYE